MELTKQSCEDFLDVLASKEPVPGGGGAAALVGAVGVALGHMVGALTVGKKKYADVQEDILALNARAEALHARLVELVEEDARAFEPCPGPTACPPPRKRRRPARPPSWPRPWTRPAPPRWR